MVIVMHKFAHCNEQKVWKIGYYNEQNKGNFVIVMTKFAAKYGGYCPKLEKNMVGLSPKTYNQTRKVSVIS